MMDKIVHPPLLHVTNKDVKQDRSQDRPLLYATCYQPLGRVRFVNYCQLFNHLLSI